MLKILHGSRPIYYVFANSLQYHILVAFLRIITLLVMRVILFILEMILYLLYRGIGCLIGPRILFILQIISFCLIGPTGMRRLNDVCVAASNLQKKNPNAKAKDGQKRVFVEFNAWVYNGTDVLWASLMECLLKSIETEYDQRAVRMHRVSIALSQETPNDDFEVRKQKRKASIFNYLLKVVVSSIVAVLGTFLGIYIPSYLLIRVTESGPTPPPSSEPVPTPLSSSSPSVNTGPVNEEGCFPGTDSTCDTAKTAIAVLTIAVSLMPFIFQLFTFFKKVLPKLSSSPVDVLLKTVYTGVAGQRRDFKADTGFMGEVKTEMEYLFDFLETHDARLCIFVDDVDRCTSQTVFDVLQAVHLLLQNKEGQSGIVTCWLAIDTRIVVSCINDVHGDILRSAGVDGYDYLEKIIQLPFCIPDLTAANKVNLLNKMCIGSNQSLVGLLSSIQELQALTIVNERTSRDLQVLSGIKFYFGPDNIDVNGPRLTLTRVMLELYADPHSTQAVKGLVKFQDDKVQGAVKGLVNVQRNERVIIDLLSTVSSYVQHLEVLIWQMVKNNVAPAPSPPAAAAAPPTPSPPTSPPTSVEPTDVEYTVPAEEENSPFSNQYTGSIIHDTIIDTRKGPASAEETASDDTGEVPTPAEETSDWASCKYATMRPDERHWINSFAVYFPGRARTLNRVLNVYNVSRIVAVKSLAERMDAVFRRKLIKIIILAEIWPCRLAWLLQIAEDALQEKQRQFRSKKVGMLMNELVIKIHGDPKESATLEDAVRGLSLTKVYDEVVSVLMYSPVDVNTALCRDGDPQLFELRLEERDEYRGHELTLADLIPLDYQPSFERPTLRPYLFNMERYMLEKTSRYMQDIIIHYDDGGVNGKSLMYERKSSCFDKVKSPPNHVLLKDTTTDEIDGKAVLSTDHF